MDYEKYLTKKQKEILNKELKTDGFCVLQKWTNRKSEEDYRVLTDTYVVLPPSIFDRVFLLFSKFLSHK